MNLEQSRVHYLSQSENPIVRNKLILTIPYKDYNFYILDEDKYDYPYLLYKDQVGEFWMFYNASISYDRLCELNNPKISEESKTDIINHFDYVVSNTRKVFDNYFKYAEDKAKHDGYFNKIELSHLEIYNPSLYRQALTSRENYLQKKHEQSEKERMQKETEDKLKIDECNTKFYEKIKKMKKGIKLGEKILSENLEYYRSDNIFDKVIQNNFLYLAKEYGINIPLSTQGFINNKLYSYNFGTGESQSYGGYKGTIMYQYLDLIKEKVLNEVKEDNKENDLEEEYEIE